MTNRTDRHRSSETGRPLRTVAIVSRNPRVNLLDAVLEAGDYDVVFIEAIEHAYSQIKRSIPHVIVLCLDVNDAAGFQILSMLHLDRGTSEIPIITYVAPPDVDASVEDSAEVDRDTLSQLMSLSMN
jgi:DNA-binding response OmpR family regulator